MSGDLKAGRGGVKVPLRWIPLYALGGAARVFEYGAAKYAPGNWIRAARKGQEEAALAVAEYVEAALRHWKDMQRASKDLAGAVDLEGARARDNESGLPHLDHMICSLLMARGIAVEAGLLDEDPGKGKTATSGTAVAGMGWHESWPLTVVEAHEAIEQPQACPADYDWVFSPEAGMFVKPVKP